MSQDRTKCIIILSGYSSGSSALQNLLGKLPEVGHVLRTRHYEHETLFWTKAASVLGLPQWNMLGSEVPIGAKKAKADLIDLLQENLGRYRPPDDDSELIFTGWKLLCEKYAPVFLEKSPHHLHQWSALELIVECIDRIPEVEFLIIGLVRNPMDVLYSMWRRWGFVPERHQDQWSIAYRNLLRLKNVLADKMVIVRYEDMIKDLSCLRKAFDFIGASEGYIDCGHMYGKSVGKWKRDRFYGFTLSEEVVDVAERFGYTRGEISNGVKLFWPLQRDLLGCVYGRWRRARLGLRNVKRELRFGIMF